MTVPFDMLPTARYVAAVATGVTDDQLAVATPCEQWRLADLLDHLTGLAAAFTGAAVKAPDAAPSGPVVDGSRLAPNWRDELDHRLTALGEAWRDPAAWTGHTSAGGVEMPGADAALVTLDELVIHGWDVARASGRPYTTDPNALEHLHGFLQAMAQPGVDRGDIFGPIVAVPDDAPLIDRVVGLAGRRPDWTPPTGD